MNIYANLWSLNESNIRHKYINRYDLYIKEYILFPKDFLNFFHPELMDLISRTDILILIYDKSKKFSFEYLKTFYYLYYLKLEEIDKPKKYYFNRKKLWSRKCCEWKRYNRY